MKTYLRLLALTGVFVLGLCASGWAQGGGADDIINKLEFIRIISAEVFPEEESSSAHYMHVIAELKNGNDKELKLAESNFNFFLQDMHDPDGNPPKIGVAECIYDYTGDPDPLLFPPCGVKNKDIAFPPNSQKSIVFEVNLERPVLKTVIRMLNFLGMHKPKQYFMIQGDFKLGIKSDKGWTYVRDVIVEWQFCPEVRDDLPIKPNCQQ